MKRFLTLIVSLTVTVMMVSCGKDTITPEELFQSGSQVAQTKISLSKEYGGTEETASFARKVIYRKSEYDGQSCLWANSSGKMVYDAFYLCVFFQDIDRMKVGDTIKPSHATFSFPASSDSGATTHEYKGKIVLADKGDDYVILDFKNVRLSCIMGDYVTDGFLYCELVDELTY